LEPKCGFLAYICKFVNQNMFSVLNILFDIFVFFLCHAIFTDIDIFLKNVHFVSNFDFDVRPKFKSDRNWFIGCSNILRVALPY